MHQSGVIWLGSDHGQVARSEDAGNNWEISRPAGSGNSFPIVQIQSVGDRQAFALTSGRGNESRLFHTRNRGFSWSQLYRGSGDETLRCFSLIADGEAWILGDTRNEEWHVVRTTNGRTWIGSSSGFSEPAQAGESAYSDSGSCVRYANDTWAMGTAYADKARLIHKQRRGLRFNVVDTPVPGGSNGGITAVWPLGHEEFLLTGGDLSDADAPAYIYQYTDGEFTRLPEAPLIGALTVLLRHGDAIVVGNTSGIAWTSDSGQSWVRIDEAAVQVTCSEGQGCVGLNADGIFRFEP
jgi:photosystem II stability/assembly factor-like uncharacterized protein